MPDDRDLLCAVEGGVGTVTFNRPSSYNCYLQATLRRVAEAIDRLAVDDAVGVIVLTGAGTRAFCTGGDVKEYAETFTKRPHAYWGYMQDFRRAIESILKCGKPVIARLNGMAIGGGNEFVLACDLAIAAEHVQIGQVGVGVGSVACGGGTQWLPLVAGDKRAREMLLLNRRLSAREAREWGLVNEVVPSVRRGGEWIADPAPEALEHAQRGRDGCSIDLSRLDERVLATAKSLLEKFPECLRYTKTQANALKEFVWNSTVGHAADWLALHFACREPYEGMTAFVEKRRTDVAGLRAAAAAGGAPEFLWGPPGLKCAGCGASGLPDGFEFCGRCGAALSGAPAEKKR